MYVPGSFRRRRERRLREEWARHLQAALGELLALPEGDGDANGGCSRPRYRLISVDDTGTHLEIELRFEAGKCYCCTEPGCFVAYYKRECWERLRSALAARSDRRPPPFTIVIHGVIESGARVRSHRSVGRDEVSPPATFRLGPVRESDAK